MKARRQDLKRPRPSGEAAKGSWSECARRTIAGVHDRLPPEATLAERIAAVDAAYPFGERAHYPYKVWCKARRNYLMRFGYVPLNAKPGPLLKLMEGQSRGSRTGG
ncbi:hypothetical protein U5903_21315 [Cereibacter johrii]|uniref:hypothetical protein n=1 Tax=Cereibacter johrii TaxID=445629 RepID=UPI002B261AB0|nr:hypothetical protein [Cereibacter johrii]MEA5163333.1 hypothetical protein [Cereibacter johrii]